MIEWLNKLLGGKPKRISKVEVGRGTDSVASTLRYMKDLVINSDRDRIVKETAKNIIKDIDPKDHERQVKEIVGWVRRKFKYVRDIYGTEELTDPVVILHSMAAGRNDYSSDCDDFATLIAALLRVVGFRTRLEAVGVMSPYYNHARLSVFLNGEWVGIEGTRNIAVGLKLPSNIPVMVVEVM